ncbi:MAG: hypothetical protein ACFBWO_16530 [Paracoccaceae bacterium]
MIEERVVLRYRLEPRLQVRAETALPWSGRTWWSDRPISFVAFFLLMTIYVFPLIYFVIYELDAVQRLSDLLRDLDAPYWAAAAAFLVFSGLFGPALGFGLRWALLHQDRFERCAGTSAYLPTDVALVLDAEGLRYTVRDATLVAPWHAIDEVARTTEAVALRIGPRIIAIPAEVLPADTTSDVFRHMQRFTRGWRVIEEDDRTVVA